MDSIENIRIFPHTKHFTSIATLRSSNPNINNITHKDFGKENLETKLLIKVEAPERLQVPSWTPLMLHNMKKAYISKLTSEMGFSK